MDLVNVDETSQWEQEIERLMAAYRNIILSDRSNDEHQTESMITEYKQKLEKERQHYLDIKKELFEKYGISTLHHVKITRQCGSDNLVKHYYDSVFGWTDGRGWGGISPWGDMRQYTVEVINELSSLPLDVTIESIMSSETDLFDLFYHPYGSITILRHDAPTHAETKEVEHMLHILVDHFPSAYLFRIIIRSNDLELIQRIMPWIKEHPCIYEEMIIDAYGFHYNQMLPPDVICDPSSDTRTIES